MTESALTSQKQKIRAELKGIRAAIPEDQRKSSSRMITRRLMELPLIQSAKTIFSFISYGNEVDTHDLLKYFLNESKRLVVPKIRPDKTMIATRMKGWDDLVAGELGILTPQHSTPYPDYIDAVITPGLGFTTDGHRIGYGRGYYDKWFSQHPTVPKIGIAFDAQIRKTLPVGESDIPVDLVITEQRIINNWLPDPPV